jgi:biopolymer transport protein ExbD
MKFGKKQRRSPEVSLIPVINIIFLLLIFFITQGSLKTPTDNLVAIPYSNSASTINAESVEVVITTSEIQFKGQVVTGEQLQTELLETLKANPNLQIMLKADAKLDSQKFLSVLKLLEKAGINNLYMVTTTQL